MSDSESDNEYSDTTPVPEERQEEVENEEEEGLKKTAGSTSMNPDEKCENAGGSSSEDRSCQSCGDTAGDFRKCSHCFLNMHDNEACALVYPGEADTGKRFARRVCGICHDTISRVLGKSSAKPKPPLVRKVSRQTPKKKINKGISLETPAEGEGAPDPTELEPVPHGLEGSELIQWIKAKEIQLVSFIYCVYNKCVFRNKSTKL